MAKIKESELQKLKEQEEKKAAILHDLGILQVQIHSLNHMYVDLMNEQNNHKKTIEDSYGKIDINLEDGTYEKSEE
jgi:predicted  nucleic acid-binding Zn-ribbon protein